MSQEFSSPSRHTITIDGAFYEVSGDEGFTLVLETDRTYRAQHRHFASTSEAITEGSDITPKVYAMCAVNPPRHVFDSEEGESLCQGIAALKLLLPAYAENVLLERVPGTRA